MEQSKTAGRRTIDCKTVMDRTGIKGRSTVWRKVRDGSLPAPIVTGANSRRWFEDEIDAWLASRPRVSYAPAAA
jgi:predicted DNA-binding transcriptional regulator AlpA